MLVVPELPQVIAQSPAKLNISLGLKSIKIQTEVIWGKLRGGPRRPL